VSGKKTNGKFCLQFENRLHSTRREIAAENETFSSEHPFDQQIISDDGAHVAGLWWGSKLIFWDFTKSAKGRVLSSVRLSLSGLAASPTGNRLASAGVTRATVWDFLRSGILPELPPNWRLDDALQFDRNKTDQVHFASSRELDEPGKRLVNFGTWDLATRTVQRFEDKGHYVHGAGSR